MPGFKLKPVVVNDRTEGLACKYCRLILREAVQTEDGDRLCRSCYEFIRENPAKTHGLSIEPGELCLSDRACRREIDRLIVKCANYREDGEGCAWEGTLKAHETEHRSQCLVKHQDMDDMHQDMLADDHQDMDMHQDMQMRQMRQKLEQQEEQIFLKLEQEEQIFLADDDHQDMDMHQDRDELGQGLLGHQGQHQGGEKDKRKRLRELQERRENQRRHQLDEEDDQVKRLERLERERERERKKLEKEELRLKKRSNLPEVYTQALMRGSVEVSYGRVMLLGLAAAGKTSLMHGLMNEPLPDKADSTILASTQSIRSYWVKTEQYRKSYWAQVTIEDEIREEGLVVQEARMRTSQHRAHPDTSATFTTTSAVVQEHKKVVLETMKSTPIPQSSDSDTNKEVLLHIWDCGGQPVFLSVLPAFLSSRTVFLLVFDASINLDEPCRVIVNYDGEQQMMEMLDISGLHLLQRWMASVHARFGRSRVAKSEKLPHYPRILLIGTHADRLISDKSEQEKSNACEDVLKKIYSVIKGKEYSNMVIGGMVVDNTTAGMGEEEDKKIKELRKNIHQFVQDKLCVATPVRWVQFRKVLQLHVKQDHPVLSLDDVKRYATESFVSEGELSYALGFYHELGVLLFYPEVPGLECVVILEPQWLVDCFGALLCKWKSRANHRYMWNILAVHGILIENLYNEVLEPILRGSQVSPQSIVEMLQHFLLAAPITTAGLHAASGKQKEYFVPLMLEHRLTLSTPSSDSPISSAVKRAATVYVIFGSGYVAPGFYVRLATCLSEREGVDVLFGAGIYRNQITMRIGDADMLIITEHIDSVEVLFFRTLNATKSFRKSCRKVRLMFSDCFSLISKWLPGVAPHVAFSCPQCESAQVSHSQARSCTFSVQHRASDALHCKGVHSFYPSHSQRYWLLPDDNVSRIEQAMEKREHQSSEFMQSLTSAIGDKMADVAKELEMSLSDDLLEQFYDNGGDDIELAQCLRAVRMRALAKRLVTGKLDTAESTTSSAPTATPISAAEAETQSGKEKSKISVVLLVDAVRNVNDWHNLGLHLYLEEAKLEEIEITYHVHGVARMKTEMFKVWLKSCPDASWHKLVSALNAIGEKRVAKEVESHYCKQLPDSHRATTVSSNASASYDATSHHCLDGHKDEMPVATRHEDTDIDGQQPTVAGEEKGRTIQGSIEDYNIRRRTVAAENLHPHDVPHLPGHDEGRQSISEPDQDKKDNSSAAIADPKPKRPASQCTTLVHCIVLSLCIYAVVQFLVLVSSLLDFLSS